MRIILMGIAVLLLPFVAAMEQTAGSKTVTLTILPNDEILVEETVILSFATEDASGSKVTHIDGLLNIVSDEETLVEGRELHSHGNEYSLTYKFPEEGEYRLRLTVFPAEEYDGEKFEPFTVEFPVAVEATETDNNSPMLVLSGIIISVLVFGTFFVLRKKGGRQ